MSFYFLEEATSFCEFLGDRLGEELDAEALRDVVAFERAGLELQRALPPAEAPTPQVVRLQYHPDDLFAAVASNAELAGLQRHPSLLIGARDRDGGVKWVVADDGRQVDRLGPLSDARAALDVPGH